MNALLRNRFEICEAVDAGVRNDIYRFRYRVYVEQMGLRQKYADHVRKRVVEPLDEAARIYAAYFNGTIVGTIRGNCLSDLPTAYYRKLYRIDDRFRRLQEMAAAVLPQARLRRLPRLGLSQRIWQRPTAILPGRPGAAASTVAQSTRRSRAGSLRQQYV